MRDEEPDAPRRKAKGERRKAPFPIAPQRMLDTVAAFETVIRSLETGATVVVGR